MKVVILTSSPFGTAAYILPQLINSNCCEVSMVILNEGHIRNAKKHYLQKIKKMFKIGVLGALNGIRMRKWFDDRVQQYISFKHIEDTCKESNIPFFRVNTINSAETKDLFNLAKADVGLSLGNGYIAKSVFSIPTFGMLNIHHEKLPEYQNAQSIIWQLYNGSNQTGYTIHKIDQHIDTGEILYQADVPIQFKPTLADTIASTSALLLQSSAKGLIHVLQSFEFLSKNARPQGEGKKYTTPSFREYLIIHSNYRQLLKKSKEKDHNLKTA